MKPPMKPQIKPLDSFSAPRSAVIPLSLSFLLGLGCAGDPMADSCGGAACATPSVGRDSADVNPGQPGPRATTQFTLQVPVAGTKTEKVTVVGPSDDGKTLSQAGAPFPLVVLSPGFIIPDAQYTDYAQRLASFGFVAVLQAPRNQADHAQCTSDTLALITWLLAPTGAGATQVAGFIDPAHIGVAGHSLGGKISILAAAQDSRIKALFGIDPVDGPVGQPSAQAAIGNVHLPAGIPIGFLGETLSSGGDNACAPAADNYQVLYGKAPSPIFAINFLKAAHCDFVDSFDTCVPCLFCPGGIAPKKDTHDLAVKYLAAYFLWALKGDTSVETYLNGAEFQQDQATGQVSEMSR